MLLTIVSFIIVLSVLVLIHELGHFLTAKKLGVKVEEFGFGFPPRIYGKKIGETLYSINLLPIGGFVKLYGEDDAGAGKVSLSKSQRPTTKDQTRAYFTRPVWQRGAIVVAGVIMNFLLAVAIISYLYSVPGVPTAGDKVTIAQLVPGAPAQKAGLHIGDTITAINKTPITLADQVSTLVKKNLGHPIVIQIKNQKNQTSTTAVIPRTHYPSNQGALGIVMSNNNILKKYPWYEAPIRGTIDSLQQSWMIVQGLGKLVNEVAVKREVPQDVAGPIAIAQLTGQFAQYGFNSLLSLVALLSLNLAVVNILPIPALDGGRFFFILIEAITRWKIPSEVEGRVNAIGMIVLLGLIVLITFHDIFRLFTGQPLLPKM